MGQCAAFRRTSSTWPTRAGEGYERADYLRIALKVFREKNKSVGISDQDIDSLRDRSPGREVEDLPTPPFSFYTHEMELDNYSMLYNL
jgi:hypothetical protein